MKAFARVLLIFLLCGSVFAKPGDGKWLRKVSAKDRNRSNPLVGDADAAAAGARIFVDHCAQCHGANAEGNPDPKHFRPNLHSARVKTASPGELYWLLTNGSLRNGMPSWSRLPEPQRWQLIAFLKSLP